MLRKEKELKYIYYTTKINNNIHNFKHFILQNEYLSIVANLA